MEELKTLADIVKIEGSKADVQKIIESLEQLSRHAAQVSDDKGLVPNKLFTATYEANAVCLRVIEKYELKEFLLPNDCSKISYLSRKDEEPNILFVYKNNTYRLYL